MSDETRSERARARASWPIHRTTLEEERAPDVSGFTSSERVAMVWQLTLDAWATRGEPIPSYTRAEAPGRIRRREDPPS
jgi:hypothetical protein